jgi:hypothetical protein
MPAEKRNDLIKVEISLALYGSEGRKLKDQIGEPEKRENEPDSTESGNTTQAIAERQLDGIRPKQKYIAQEKSGPWKKPQGRGEHDSLPNE